MSLLKRGRMLVSHVTGHRYRVASSLVAEGGFGQIYRGEQVDAYHRVLREVAIKVGLEAFAWHGEAYFNRLLKGQSRVVPLHDAFPLMDGGGLARQTKYLLVFDWMPQGTVHDLLEEGKAWTEAAVIREIRGILEPLALLHGRGICHADVTPRNVFIDGRRLLLGDLGIAKQTLVDKPIVLDAAAPPIFFPPDATPWGWTPADDVYQVGLIALCLLSGEIVTTDEVCGRLLRTLKADDGIKGWIHSALTHRGERYRDAGEARECLGRAHPKFAHAPRSLNGQVLVFTGVLPVARQTAIRRAIRKGATVQAHVTARTTLLVRGDANVQMIGQEHGRKLFDAQRRITRGQRIALIGYEQFERLLGR